jgi:HTH-type transcriptional regulator, transcriptional repressor of NAD biosynthesis genes
MSRGFLLGKFMPPHQGHVLLTEFASAYCDELTVLVCTRECEPIDGALRYRWMRELCPNARVVHFTQDVPQEPGDHPDFWQIWRDIVKKAHPECIDYIFASETYGERLAAEVGARWVPVDPARQLVPISASQIRENPYAAWIYLPAPVRAHYVKTVCLHGPESTGKSTLASRLAERFGTISMPEYGRTYCEAFGTDCTADDLANIVRGHDAFLSAARMHANKLLILDTDAVMTAVWADMLLESRPANLDRIEHYADYYLLCDVDAPWVDDGTRYFPDAARRETFYARAHDELVRRELPFATLSGDWDRRFDDAVKAIKAHFPDLEL